MRFVNPYNFVSLEQSSEEQKKQERKIPINEELYGEKLYTGVLNCTLTTKTPLFIPNTTNDHTFKKENGHYKRTSKEEIQDAEDKQNIEENHSKSYDFYSYNDQKNNNKDDITPIIPGSSIRGVVRSVYETITNSCLATSGGRETPLYRRSTVPRTEFGIIKGNTLYKADKLLVKPSHRQYNGKYANTVETITDGETGDAVSFDVSDETYMLFRKNKPPYNTGLHFAINIGNGEYIGYYLRGEEFGDNKKHFDAIIVPYTDNNSAWIVVKKELTEKDFDRLETVLRLYKKREDDNIGVNQTKHHAAYKDYFGDDGHLDKTKVLPVYYRTLHIPAPNDDKLYISPACMTKEVFDRSVADILKSMGGFEACSEEKNLCETCHLFGMVGESGNARSSRLQFRDAKPLDAGPYFGEVTAMAILGSPKISATEFYMQDPDKNSSIFNYDYKSTRQQLREIKNVQIRGRKYYWHHSWGENYPIENEPTDKPKLFQIVRPVKPGLEFGFTVAFERLTLTELQKLVYALQLQDGHAHKIGHGKPIGYGSVQISIDFENEEINTGKVIEKSKVYSLDENFKLVNEGLPKEVFDYICDNEEFLALTNIAQPKQNIKYPVGTEITVNVDGNTGIPKSETFRWFVLNREATGSPSNSTTNPITAYVLPKANADNVSLPMIEKTVTWTRQPNGISQSETTFTKGGGSNRAAVWDWFH